MLCSSFVPVGASLYFVKCSMTNATASKHLRKPWPRTYLRTPLRRLVPPSFSLPHHQPLPSPNASNASYEHNKPRDRKALKQIAEDRFPTSSAEYSLIYRNQYISNILQCEPGISKAMVAPRIIFLLLPQELPLRDTHKMGQKQKHVLSRLENLKGKVNKKPRGSGEARSGTSSLCPFH